MPKLLWSTILIVLGLAAGFWLTAALWCPGAIDITDRTNWVPIRSFDGLLNPSDGIVHADVYVVDSLIDGPISDPTFQNMIELTSSHGSAQFRWPSSKDFAGGWCEVSDLDGDGWLEFILIRGAMARVVAYRDGGFIFRSGQDQILAAERVRALDLDGDGQLEFVIDGPLLLGAPQAGAESTKPVAVWKWKKDFGFVKVSDSLPMKKR